MFFLLSSPLSVMKENSGVSQSRTNAIPCVSLIVCLWKYVVADSGPPSQLLYVLKSSHNGLGRILQHRADRCGPILLLFMNYSIEEMVGLVVVYLTPQGLWALVHGQL